MQLPLLADDLRVPLGQLALETSDLCLVGDIDRGFVFELHLEVGEESLEDLDIVGVCDRRHPGLVGLAAVVWAAAAPVVVAVVGVRALAKEGERVVIVVSGLSG